MSFPRTLVGGVSMPRLICGSNWMLGYSHTSKAKDRLICDLFDTPQKVADVVEVFARAGCNAYMSMPTPFVAEALREVEQRTGQPMLWVATPSFPIPGADSWEEAIDLSKRLGATFCFPHQCLTDAQIDRTQRQLTPTLQGWLRQVRDAGLVPGLSSHAPEVIPCADATPGMVETYITPYNAAGFLCQVETDWVQNTIHAAKCPVMTIKPLGAGRLLPPTGLAFVWNTIRDCDMVTIGTMSVYEAEEDIELSLAALEQRASQVELQSTRSKKLLK